MVSDVSDVGQRLAFRFRDFCQFLRVLVSENLVSENFFRFGKFSLKRSLGFGKFDLGKKVSVLVSENLASERKNKNNKKEKSTK